jgi:hypothetical protein
MAEHGLAQQGGRFNILYAEHRTEKTISSGINDAGCRIAGCKLLLFIVNNHWVNACINWPQSNHLSGFTTVLYCTWLGGPAGRQWQIHCHKSILLCQGIEPGSLLHNDYALPLHIPPSRSSSTPSGLLKTVIYSSKQFSLIKGNKQAYPCIQLALKE